MTQQTFETIYPKAPFAELIRLGIVAAQWFARQRAKHHDAALPAGTVLSH
jgi:hypothetical protein